MLLDWIKKYNIFLAARYISGNRNIIADRLSRSGIVMSIEWMFDTAVFR